MSKKTAVGTPDPDGPIWEPCSNPDCACQSFKITPVSELTEAELGKIRQFASGATRDSDEGKLDFEAYLNPLVLLRYAEYMQKHQTRSDGTKRAGDDWQQGMPSDEYMKSMTRHAFDVWLHHRNYGDLAREDLETALCAVIFNAMGYLFNELEGNDGQQGG